MPATASSGSTGSRNDHVSPFENGGKITGAGMTDSNGCVAIGQHYSQRFAHYKAAPQDGHIQTLYRNTVKIQQPEDAGRGTGEYVNPV